MQHKSTNVAWVQVHEDFPELSPSELQTLPPFLAAEFAAHKDGAPPAQVDAWLACLLPARHLSCQQQPHGLYLSCNHLP